MKTYWCIKSPNKKLVLSTVAETSAEARFFFQDGDSSWKEFYKQGYRAVKVRIEEVEK